jgi:hypothetical protein
MSVDLSNGLRKITFTEEEATMKMLQRIFGVGVAVTLLGVNLVLADISTDASRKPLSFPLDIGDGSLNLPEVSFDAAGDEEAQTTCAMTPGGPGGDFVLPLPPITVPRGERFRNPQWSSAGPLGSLPPPPKDNPSRRRRPPTPPPPPPPPPVPEPATLLIVGLGIGAIAVVRQRGEKVTYR